MIRCFAMAVFLSSALLAAADPLDHWHWRTPLPQGYTLNGAAIGADLCVAVGELGTVLVSINGLDWLITNAPVVTNLSAVCFTGDRFVAVGEGGTILTSDSGTSWTVQSSPTTNHLYAVAPGGGLLVATGERGTIVTSPNGNSWTVRNAQLDATAHLNDVTYGDGRFVAVGSGLHEDFFYGLSATSTDGISWESTGLGAALAPFSGVAYGNGVYLATSGAPFAISTDGRHWSYYYLGGGRTNVGALTFSEGRFIGAGALGIMESVDGTNWIAAGVPGSFRDIVTGGGKGLAVGDGGSLASSSDLIDWATVSSGLNFSALKMIFGKDRFIGVGAYIYTSFGGQVWTRQIVGTNSNPLLPAAYLDSVAYGKGLFIAVGRHYLPLTNVISIDGYLWKPLAIPVTNPLATISFVNDRFVAGGEGGTLCDSIDGTNWTTHTVAPGLNIGAITYGNGQYVAAGVGAIYTSTDLETWTYRAGTNVIWRSLAFGNGMFVAGGVVLAEKTGIPILRSMDGLNWEPASSYPPYLFDLAFGRGVFVAAASNGIVTSTNGMDWLLRQSRLFPTARTVAFGLETFVVNRFQGGIVQSDPMVPLPMLGAPVFAHGQFQWSIVNGATGSTYLIQSSGDLEDWTDETTIAPLQFPFALTNQTSLPARFYRVVSQ